MITNQASITEGQAEVQEIIQRIDTLQETLQEAYKQRKERESSLSEAEQLYFQARGGINELEDGIPAFKILMQAGLADSGKAAKRLIQGGGGRINDNKIEDEMLKVSLDFINDDGVIKLSSGKKKHALVKAV